MPTLRDRLRAFLRPSEKMYYPQIDPIRMSGGSGWSIISPAYVTNAYISNDAVRTCVDLYATLINQLPWRIIANDPETDEIVELATSDDPEPRHAFDFVLREYSRQFRDNLIQRIAYSLVLFDEVFVYLDYSGSRAVGLQWLNNNYVQISAISGSVDYFDYQPPNGSSKRLPPHLVAYEHGYNPDDDLRGLTPLASILKLIDITNSSYEHIRNYYRNDGRPNMLVFPRDQAHQIPQAAEAIRNELYKSLTGVGNAGRSLVSHIPLEIQTFEQADLDKNTAILDTIRNRIFSAFRVPLMLVGDNTNTPYKEANETLNAFIQLQVKPLAERITQFINQQLMPAVMASELFRFEFVYDDYQTVSSIETSNSTLTIQQYTSGIIDRAEAKRRLGVEPDAQDNGVYAVNLQPADSILFSKTTSCSCGDHHGHDEPPTAIRTLIPRSSIKSISPDDIAAVAQWMGRAGLDKLTAGYTELQRTLAQAGGGTFDNVEVDWNEDDFETLLGQYRLEAMELANQLERGQISPQQWLDQMTELLRRFHIAAGIVGVGGVENVNNGTLNESENNFYDQLGYLVNWAQTGIAIGLAADAILNRAMLYAANGRATAERARLRRMGLPELPAYPGDGTTDCRTNCKCRWDIKKLDGDGNFDCRWVIDPLYENCQHCVARSKTWQPLEIRGGVIKPYPRDANLWR